jgi:hypothetical protein
MVTGKETGHFRSNILDTRLQGSKRRRASAGCLLATMPALYSASTALKTLSGTICTLSTRTETALHGFRWDKKEIHRGILSRCAGAAASTADAQRVPQLQLFRISRLPIWQQCSRFYAFPSVLPPCDSSGRCILEHSVSWAAQDPGQPGNPAMWNKLLSRRTGTAANRAYTRAPSERPSRLLDSTVGSAATGTYRWNTHDVRCSGGTM